MTVRLLTVVAETRPSGWVGQLLRLLPELPAAGIQPELICVARNDDETVELEARLSKAGIGCEVLRESGTLDRRPWKEIERIVTEQKPDIVETHGYKPNVMASLMLRRAKVPWVAFYHGRTSTNLRVRMYHQLDRFAMSRATKIVTVSEGVRSHFRPSDRARVEVIENAVPSEKEPTVRREDARRSFDLPVEDTLIGVVGRLSHEKGQDVFVRAMATVAKGNPGRLALLVGDGSYRSRLQSLADEVGIADRIRFLGHVQNITDLYRALDLLVIPSRSEVFPNVLLEAAMAEVPIVATSVGGIPWIADGLPSIRLVRPEDHKGMADAIDRILADPGPEAAALTRATVLRRYSLKARAAAHAELYRRLVSELEPDIAPVVTESPTV